jgi:hypothetical protein
MKAGYLMQHAEDETVTGVADHPTPTLIVSHKPPPDFLTAPPMVLTDA